ncbi:MAG: DEAD/DEAH box helicase [Mesorhizobium amorphae]|nr:MAG: DEAD/DEAH box helicase [Mesorhizobium amorphae]
MEAAEQSATSSAVVGGGTLAPGGIPSRVGLEGAKARPPASAVAARLIAPVFESGTDGLVFLARGEFHAEEIARAVKAMAPGIETIVLPPWDCLPYDRVAPSRESMGRRMSALHAMAQPAKGSRLVVMSAEAALNRVVSPDAIAGGFTEVAVGDAIEPAALGVRLQACGYVLDDRVDEPGEAALLGQVIDVFPPDMPRPVRILLDEEGGVQAMRFYDPVTQRTHDAAERVVLGPASELAPLPENTVASRGMEERMMASGLPLASVFHRLGDARIVIGAEFPERLEAAFELIADARRARDTGKGRKPPKTGFHLGKAEWKAAVKGRAAPIDMAGAAPVPLFLLEDDPVRAAVEFIREKREAGFRVLLAGSEIELDPTSKALARRLKEKPESVEGWSALLDAEDGALVQAMLDLEHGFTDDAARIAVVASADIYGTRLGRAKERGAKALVSEPELRLGNVVLHEDHGVAVLRALETVEAGGVSRDVVRLEYHGGATLLAPVEEFGRIWRYGADEEAVTLDRLKGDGWAKRRAEVSVEIAAAAGRLVELAAEREKKGADAILPPRGAYGRFAARFPYPETPDQTAAIEAVLTDLASGKAMNRLICGDVGFGKTEVALRAAAAVALGGRQVAVVAPTTVLARQHFETFSRRFEGTGVRVALLSRVVKGADAKAVKGGLADGSVGIVVATQAVAAKDVRFRDLGLLVIDEEHRFGVRLKEELRGLAPRLHVLSMSATPIPRTLASAMVGVQEASLLSNPPARRRPVRTELAPFDAASIKTALIREAKRGGQSFCVVPRIEDIEPLKAELARLVPDLKLLTAHGDMDASAMDESMLAFANGQADILLSTNIIETGLDVPRANTILVFRADRFGMAQLHQLRGRVGRGRAQGFAFLLTEAGREIAAETRSRLSTLLAFDRLGSGLAISARDLDLRGAGDLVGEEQAGHMKLIGVSLYQRLLARAVEAARGEGGALSFEPEIKMEMSGAFPAEYVPEPIIRLNLYSRLQRFERESEIDAFAEELADRFGQPPAETTALLELARLKLSAASAGVARISAGPSGIAIDLRRPKTAPWEKLKRLADCAQNDNRLICRRATPQGPERLEAVGELVEAVRKAVV